MNRASEYSGLPSGGLATVSCMGNRVAMRPPDAPPKLTPIFQFRKEMGDDHNRSMVVSDESGFAREREGAFDHLVKRRDRLRLGGVLRSFREEAGLQQGDLASRLDVPQSVLSKIESGHREVTMLEVRVICGALNVSVAKFVVQLDERLRQEG